MAKYLKIEGIVEIRDDESIDLFTDKFIDFLEENKWYFGGGSNEVDENGNEINSKDE